MKKIMVFGAFDGLHPGHLSFFKQAKKYGDYLVVSVGRDVNVAKFKGRKPLFSEKERLELVENLKIVDKAVLGDKKDFMPHIVAEAPNIICLGYDQWANERELKRDLEKEGLVKTRVVRLVAYKPKVARSRMLRPGWKRKLTT